MNGISRATSDADFWIEPSDESKTKILKIFLEMNYEEEELSEINKLDFKMHQVITIQGLLDILTFVNKNISFQDCFSRTIVAVLSNGINLR